MGYQLGDDVGVNYVVMQIHYAHAIAGKLACYGTFYLIGFPISLVIVCFYRPVKQFGLLLYLLVALIVSVVCSVWDTENVIDTVISDSIRHVSVTCYLCYIADEQPDNSGIQLEISDQR